jgi:hypothetical protein
MKKFKLLLLAMLAVFVFTGCNEQVPAGHVGKILGKSGFQPEVFPPSKVWLANNIWNINHEKLVLVETTTEKYNEPITVLLADKLELSADIIFRCRINSDDEKVINGIFNDIKVGNDLHVSTDEVYNIYGKMIVLNTAREVISKYNVDEVNTNYARITQELYQAVAPKLEGLPIEISDITIGNIKYPKIVTDAIEKAKERRMQIEEMEAEVQKRLTEAKGREELAKTEYNIKMMEAKRIRDYNKMISEGVNQNLLELRKLEVQERMVDAIQENKNVIYMPMDMMSGVSMMRSIQ